MIRIAVAGVLGRMGKAIVETIAETEGVELGAGSVKPGSAELGKDIGLLCGLDELNVKTVADFGDCLDDFDVLIDFTSPEATLVNIKLCAAAAKKVIIGTTGFTEEQKSLIKSASEQCAIVFAPNMSVGVNLCFKLLEQAAKVLGEESDIEIIEAHHRYKKDAPSGTALRMGEVVASTLGRNLDDCAVYSREGNIGERVSGSIGFQSIRAGNIVGDHTVMFSAAGETVEITHKSSSRVTYAAGSLRAALWLSDKSNGLFDMQDVLGLS